MTIVFQPSPTQKNISNPLRLLVWTSLLPLSSLYYLLSLLQKYLSIQLRLTRRLLHLFKLLTILQLKSQTSLLPRQLDYSSQFRCLKSINLKLQKNFLHLTRFYRSLDPFFHVPITSNFGLIIILLDVSIAVNTMLITHGEQNDPALINIYKTVKNKNSPHGK